MIPDRVVAALRPAARPVCAYVYDTGELRARARAVRDALPPSARLLYAVKANGHPDLLGALTSTVDGLEVASGGELELAESAGARHLAFGGPAKTDTELRAAVAAGATVNVESVLELRRLALVAAGRRVPVALRVNRTGGVALPGSHQMAGTPTPFGIDEGRLPEAVAVAAGLPGVELVGLHLHAVSNNLDAAAHAAFVRDALAWSAGTGLRPGSVNVGGGFGVDYTGGRAFDLAALRDGLAGVPAAPRLVFELGRYLAAGAGWYAAEVLDLKYTHGRWFAVLRGGTHHFRLPAAWGYSHPFEVLPVARWDYPFDRPEVAGVPVDAVGELCTPRDVLTRGQRVDRLRAGDVLVFGNAGAYGWDISHHEFLRHPYPEMIVI
ncbi:MAG TPA: alanine racemase [Rugosimonospora sp.]|nr:alanine racemase [Rugosimonospora sp.]